MSSLLLTLITCCALVWAQEPATTTESDPRAEPEPQTSAEPSPEPVDPAIPIVTDLEPSDMVPHAVMPQTNETAVMNTKEPTVAAEPSPANTTTTTTTMAPPSAAPQLGALSAAVLCLLSTLIVS